MNNHTTSNDTSISPSAKVWVVMNSANSLEFRIAEGDFPTNGDSRPDRYFESLYVGELMNDTIGLIGTFDLWILGNPYSNGVFPATL